MTFALPMVRARWIWNVRQFLQKAWGTLRLPTALVHIRDYDEWKRFVLSQGKNEKGETYLVSNAGEIARMRCVGWCRKDPPVFRRFVQKAT